MDLKPHLAELGCRRAKERAKKRAKKWGWTRGKRGMRRLPGFLCLILVGPAMNPVHRDHRDRLAVFQA
jgi:hypothetical protein